jgi:hypothetical protein
MDLHSRLVDFIDSLEKYPPKEHPAFSVAEIHNALLAAVKEACPNDPIVSVIRAVGHLGMSDKSGSDAGSLVASAQQMLNAVDEADNEPRRMIA